MSKFSAYEFRTQPWFDQDKFQDFNFAIPMKTMVIHCFDPRAAEIPQAVARYFGDEVYPGENVLDAEGHRVGHTRTLFAASNAGGRAFSALQSVATMEYLFQIKRVVVVHHSFCGASAFRPDQLLGHFHDDLHADIAPLIERDSLAITDFEKSVRHDIELLRASPAVPASVELYGFFYEISSGALTEIVRDLPAK